LENLSDGKDKNRAWENSKETFKSSAKESLGLYELKQHKYGLMNNVYNF
jgi:hypothetical protein